ncbi:MAG: hypothetical protein MZW92_63760 [Comamonadaceae bacterium]|nr:hypothetical protein [Comamonadaceae bacterium]
MRELGKVPKAQAEGSIILALCSQQWLTLRTLARLAENPALEMTRKGLPLASMIPSDVEQELRAIVGDAYQGLDELRAG